MLPVLSPGVKFVSVAVKVIQIQVLVLETKIHGISVNKLVMFKYVQLLLLAYLITFKTSQQKNPLSSVFIIQGEFSNFLFLKISVVYIIQKESKSWFSPGKPNH